MKTIEANAHAADPTRRNARQQFGTFLRQLRLRSGIDSQKEAAHRLTQAGYRLSQNGVAQLELGRVYNLSDSNIDAIANVYGSSYEEVLGELLREQRPRLPDGVISIIKRPGSARSVHEVQQLITAFAEEKGEGKHVFLFAPNFRDDRDEVVRAATIRALRLGVHYTFFIHEQEAREEIFEGSHSRPGRFFALKMTLMATVGPKIVNNQFKHKAISSEQELLNAACDFVILSSQETVAGFHYFRDQDDTPAVALPMPPSVLEPFVGLLKKKHILPRSVPSKVVAING